GLILTATSGREDPNTFRNDTRAIVSLRDPGLAGSGAPVPAESENAESEDEAGATQDTSAETEDAGGPAFGPVQPDDPTQTPGTAPDSTAVPVALTRSLADTGNFEVGASITIQAFGRNIP